MDKTGVVLAGTALSLKSPDICFLYAGGVLV